MRFESVSIIQSVSKLEMKQVCRALLSISPAARFHLHEWYTVTPPRLGSGDFRITTMGDIDPRESNTVWSLPAPAFTFNTPLPDTAYRGLFGDIPREEVSTYPVDLYVAGNGDTVQVFSVKSAELVRKGKGKWSLE